MAALRLLGFEAVGVDKDAATVAAATAATGSQVMVGDAGALPFPEAHFGWVVAFRLLPSLEADERDAILRELYRVLEPGGWIYMAVETDAAPESLTDLMLEAGFALAERPVADFDADEARLVRGIYRRIESGVVG